MYLLKRTLDFDETYDYEIITLIKIILEMSYLWKEEKIYRGHIYTYIHNIYIHIHVHRNNQIH